MSGVFGDLSELRQLRHALQQCADGTAMRQLKALVGEEAVTLARNSFKTQTDPFGNPWKPSARALREAGETLSKTATGLRSRIAMMESPTGVLVGTNVIYAATHNFGDTRTHTIRGQPRTFTFPRRQFIPTETLGNWGPALDEVITEYVLELFGG